MRTVSRGVMAVGLLVLLASVVTGCLGPGEPKLSVLSTWKTRPADVEASNSIRYELEIQVSNEGRATDYLVQVLVEPQDTAARSVEVYKKTHSIGDATTVRVTIPFDYDHRQNGPLSYAEISVWVGDKKHDVSNLYRGA